MQIVNLHSAILSPQLFCKFETTLAWGKNKFLEKNRIPSYFGSPGDVHYGIYNLICWRHFKTINVYCQQVASGKCTF